LKINYKKVEIMKNNKNDFDDILNDAFLDLDFSDPKNESLLNAVSNQIVRSNPVVATTSGSFTVLKKLLKSKIAFSIYGAILVSSLLYLNHINNQGEELELLQNQEQIKNEFISFDSLSPIQQKSYVKLESLKQKYKKPISAESILPEIDLDLEYTTINELRLNYSSIAPEPYRFPSLTLEQIKENNKQKESMLKDVLKLDKGKYSSIEISKQPKTNSSYVLQDFYIRTTELTNVEYRTFLFDLLISGRKADFLIAKPKQDEWLTLDNSKSMHLKDLYFSHPAYYNYPVVNISRKGAEMYCEWLSDLVSKSYKNRKKIETVRLPYSVEWKYAASGGQENNKYPWGGPYVRNSEGEYLANFHPIKNNPNIDGGLFTVASDSYYPNDFGLYNMSGNVAEMVTYFQKDTLEGTNGGSFNDVAKFIQLNAPDQNKGVTSENTFIGFRPVVIIDSYLDRLIGVMGSSEDLEGISKEEKRKIVYNKTINFYDRYASSFSLVKGGDYKIMDQQEYINPYLIQRTEVSNAEFKLFIEDLKNESKFILSQEYQPDGSKWGSEALAEYYFSHPSYDSYPVVNISREAAIAYCKWLEASINRREVSLEIKGGSKPIQVIVELPTEKEWIAAASNLGKYNKYPWHSTLKNNGKKYFGYSSANYLNNDIEGLGIPGQLNENAELTAHVKSYWPNTLGLYNIGGNVAEMIQYENGEIGARGGSWNKVEKYTEIHAKDPFVGNYEPNKEIGFRPVIRIVE
jgi:formylglycine-generating enzyme required for sulfatase activity